MSHWAARLSEGAADWQSSIFEKTRALLSGILQVHSAPGPVRLECELQFQIGAQCAPPIEVNRRNNRMALMKPLSKEVFIRIEGIDAFVSTVKYGCFYSKTREFSVCRDRALVARPQPKYLVPPITMAMKK